MPQHARQHFIPRSYLTAWCDPDTPDDQEPFVWRFPKEGGDGARKAPKKLFTETDIYTIRAPDGARDLRLEHGLADLESQFADIRSRVVEPRAPLDPQSRFGIIAFMAAMQARTPKQRDHWKSQWEGLLEDMDAIREQVSKMTPAQRAALPPSMPSQGPSLGYDDVKELASTPIPSLLHTAMEGTLPLLLDFNLAVLTTETDPGFITSDAPCAWFDPEAYKRPAFYRGVGLMYPKVEITLPLSPRSLALLSRKAWPDYVPVPEPVVDDINRRTRAYAQEYFVVRRNQTKDIWYELGSPPA